jgi:hypothetical protein
MVKQTLKGKSFCGRPLATALRQKHNGVARCLAMAHIDAHLPKFAPHLARAAGRFTSVAIIGAWGR